MNKSGSKGAIPKRTRAQVGTTNRKRVVEENEPKSPTPQRSSPKSYSPPLGEDRQSTLMSDTVSSLSKHYINNSERRTPPAKAKDDKQNTGSPLSNLELMQCRFVESFEEGTAKIRLGDTYNNQSVEVAPTRFSSAPPPHSTSHLTYGEQGTPAYATEQQRLATTYHTTIHSFPEPPGDPIRRDKEPIIYDDNIQQKAISKEREAGRLARIRDNNARVEASNDAFQNKLHTDASRRVVTVKKQQEGYAQAIAERKARIGE